MAPRYSIRSVRNADLERILAIEQASFGADAYDRNLFAYYQRAPGSVFLGAWRGRVFAGYAILQVRQRSAELVSVAVHPAFRRSGAASALMDSLLRRLARRGVPRMVLIVKVTNTAAQEFYSKYDFRTIRRVRAYYEDGADGWLMELRRTAAN